MFMKPKVIAKQFMHKAMETKKKKGKRKPIEMSTKKWVPPIFETEQKKRISRDPRFEDINSSLNEGHFKQAYFFLDEMKEQEIQQLKIAIKKCKDEEAKKSLQRELSRAEQKKLVSSKKNRLQQIRREHRKLDSKLANEGKRRFFLKNSDIKEIALVDEYEKKKESGDIDKYIAKKRKRRAAKDRRYLPYRRRMDE